MNTPTLFNQFSQGLNWNALLYITYKVLFTLLSFFLYKSLTTTDFSTWANLNSIIFLTLLWIDCGLRKSIPRFCPLISLNSSFHRRFITILILLQASLLMLCIPLLYYLIINMATALHLEPMPSLFIYAALIFIVEGITNIIRLIYHAHFWIKQFNSINITTLLIEMIANFVFIYAAPSSYTLLQGVLFTKIISGSILLLITIIRIPTLNKATSWQSLPLDIHTIVTQFTKHSGIMWFNNTIKSLSERNFMLPLLTYTLGPHQANIFKLANDGALLFYRSVIKTIGTTDTTLLSYAITSQDKAFMPQAFRELFAKVLHLSLAFLGILLFLVVALPSLPSHELILHTFWILTFSYLIEAMLSPFERLLEVHLHYWMLFISYIPYMLGMLLICVSDIPDQLGLIGCVILVQIVRLSGSLLTTFFARYLYRIELPLKPILVAIAIAVPTYTMVYFFIYKTNIGIQMVNRIERLITLPTKKV